MTTTVGADFADRAWKYWTTPETVIVDGLETVYRRSGQGEPVLYLHGVVGTRSWLPFYSELAEHVDLVVPEHPGFGDTPRPGHFNSWDDWLLHYDGFLRALGLDRVHLAGHSLGGMMAAKLAVQYPDRFKSVTLVNPFGLRLVDEPLRDLYRWSEEESDRAYFNGRRSRYSELLVQYGGVEDTVNAYAEAASTALLFWNPRYDVKLDHRLARVTSPFLSIGVDDDGVMGNVMAQRYSELVPGGKYKKISGPAGEPSSHMVVVEQPEETAAVIAEHVRAGS